MFEGGVEQQSGQDEGLQVSAHESDLMLDLYENAPHAYFSVGTDGVIRRCNRRAELLLGCARETLVGKEVLDLYAEGPQGREKAQSIFRRFRVGAPIADEELLMSRADGTTVWISLTVNAVRSAQGEILESRSMVVDIEARKQAEAERDAALGELQTAHSSLEKRVGLRTSELSALNKRLQDEVSQRAGVEEQLSRRLRELAALHQTSLAINALTELSVLFGAILEQAVEMTGARMATLSLLPPGEESLEIVAVHELPSRFVGVRLGMGEGLVGRVARSGEPLAVPDYTEMHGRVGSSEASALGRALGVPLKVGGRVSGVLTLHDPPMIGQFDEDEIRLASQLAAQAAIAVENARLFTQLQRELERRRETEESLRRSHQAREVLSESRRILSHAQDVDTLVRDVCQTVVDAGSYRLAWVGFAEHDEGRTVRPDAKPGYEEGYLDTLRITWADEERGRGPTGTAIREHRPCASRNILEDPRFAPWRAEAVRRGYGSSLALPLISGDQCLGALNIYAAEPDAFDDKEIELLTQVAEDLAFGLESLGVRAERQEAAEDLENRNRELTALNAIASSLSRSMDTGEVLSTTVDTVLDLVGLSAGWARLLDCEPDGSSSRPAAYRGLSPAMIRALEKSGWDAGLADTGDRGSRPGSPAGVDEDPRGSAGSAAPGETPACTCVPLRAKDTVLGELGVLKPQGRRLTTAELDLLRSIALQAGMALENIRLAREASENQILREVDRFRTELIANVSHELRTPLGLIKIFASTLLREDVEFDRETLREFLGNIDEEADNLELIVDNLLGLGRVDSRRLRLARQPVDIGQLATHVGESLAAKYPGHEFVYEFPADPLVVPVDRGCLEQILRNLLDNAAKYSPDGGTVVVLGRGRPGEAWVQVTDEGTGIAPDALPHIFERFFRAETEQTKAVRGVGLGLAICQELVGAHGGQIWAESTPGAGSTFTFTLPLRVDA